MGMGREGEKVTEVLHISEESQRLIDVHNMPEVRVYSTGWLC